MCSGFVCVYVAHGNQSSNYYTLLSSSIVNLNVWSLKLKASSLPMTTEMLLDSSLQVELCTLLSRFEPLLGMVGTFIPFKSMYPSSSVCPRGNVGSLTYRALDSTDSSLPMVIAVVSKSELSVR